MTFSEFSQRAAKVHSGTYLYEDTDFTGATGKFWAVCSAHGRFQQRVGDHLAGAGCKGCQREAATTRALTRAGKHLDEIRALQPQYEYRKFEETFKTVTEPVTVICHEHGEFSITPNRLKKGQGCRECGIAKVAEIRKVTFQQFVERAKVAHGDKYTYVEKAYVGYRKSTTIVCPVHGEFQQTPEQHATLGHGCRFCAWAANGQKVAWTVEEFETACKRIHSNKYVYTGDFTDTLSPVTVICPVHGRQKQQAFRHMKSLGCPSCGKEASSLKRRTTKEQFLDRARTLHGDTYQYDFEGYASQKSYVKITCKLHGIFNQTGDTHLRGSRCPICAGTVSNGQIELLEYIKSLGFCDAVSDYRYGAGKKEFDVYVPSKRTAFEYDGVYYHSSRFRADDYHVTKQREAKEAGVKLVQIYSDQWETNNKQVKALIAARLGVSSNRVHARKCITTEISNEDAQKFHNDNHVQGWKRYGENVALVYEGTVVAVMTFTNVSSVRGESQKQGQYELARFSSSFRVAGGASKLFSYFVKSRNAEFVLSYSDMRLFSGATYSALGFKLDGYTKPSYTYNKDGTGQRKHKSHFRHSNLLKVLGVAYDPALTERQNCENAGYYQIYDCGLARWHWYMKKE